jgi:dihydroneopterin aldolase/D-erythro-7,8-dihydroneopterin triphosphate epimerase
MIDRILIKDLVVRCILGVGAEERREKQEVLISVVLFTDLIKAGRSDRVEDSVDYRAVKKDILAAVDGSQYHLAEALAQRVAEACLAHQDVERVQVTVEKPGALRFARSVAIEIERSRG